MKRYSSFFVRCWLIADVAELERSVINVEHIQSGEHMRVQRMTEAEEWMFETCRRISKTESIVEQDESGET